LLVKLDGKCSFGRPKRIWNGNIRAIDYVTQDRVQWKVLVPAMLNLPVLLPGSWVDLLTACLLILYIIMAAAEAFGEYVNM
jgi:hypothetical protein